MVIVNMENCDFAIGVLRENLMSAFPDRGPFSGMEYCTPPSSYHRALVMPSWTRPPPTLVLMVRKVSLSVNRNMPRMLWLKYGLRYGLPKDTFRGSELSATGISCEVDGWEELPK